MENIKASFFLTKEDYDNLQDEMKKRSCANKFRNCKSPHKFLEGIHNPGFNYIENLSKAMDYVELNVSREDMNLKPRKKITE